jgi:site-specific DNA-methyltransferase (adenine-specific)
MIPFYEEPAGKIYYGDCLEVMKSMPDKSIDLVLTDPPYGIGAYANGTMGNGVLAKQSKFNAVNWDNSIPSKEYFDEMMRVSKNQIIFGGNYFVLPPSCCWIVWDKDNGNNYFADCELAWTSFQTAVRKFKWKWQGMLQENMKQKDFRFHPTQKPLELMRWCLEKYSQPSDIVLDPFLGSGTTARACKDLGRYYIGAEISKDYCEIAKKRLAQEVLF